MNARRTSSNTTVVAPRVAFTGRKINYKKEYELAFGTYCECYDPKVVSNDAERDRTEPCIALFPAVNANGSWVFLNLKTKKRVRRPNWVPMVTTDLVITRMNALAAEQDGENAGATLFADDTVHDTVQDMTQDTRHDVAHVPPATHHVEADTDLPMTTAEQEAAENELVHEEEQETVVQHDSPEEGQPANDDVAQLEEISIDDLSNTPEGVRRLTERHVQALERAIRRRPELWSWQHRRWRQDES
jgi:hypothetical protein